MLVISQNGHEHIRYSNISRSKVERKEEGIWTVTVTVTPDCKAIVMARYPNEKDAILADVNMWLEGINGSSETYIYPT